MTEHLQAGGGGHVHLGGYEINELAGWTPLCGETRAAQWFRIGAEATCPRCLSHVGEPVNQPTHRERAESYLQRAAMWLDAIPGDDEDHATVAATLGTGYAVLAHLDALGPAPGGIIHIDSSPPDRGTSKAVRDAIRHFNQTGALPPLDQSGLTSGSDDHAEPVIAGAPVAAGATNGPSPVSPDAKIGTGDLRAKLIEALRALDRPLRNVVEVAAEWAYADLADELADALLADGWRPPLPDGEQGLPLNTAPGAVTRLGVNIGPRTAEALNTVMADHHVTLTEALRSLVAGGYTAHRQPAPRVFFPGDTVPADVALMDGKGLLDADNVDRVLSKHIGPAIELTVPSRVEWQAVVDQARAERDLRLHLASVHKNAAAFDLPASELEDVHHHDHTGPGGIRTHDIADRSYDEATANAVAEEADRG